MSFHYWPVLHSQFPSIETGGGGKCPALCRWVGDKNQGVMQRERERERKGHAVFVLVGAWVGELSPPSRIGAGNVQGLSLTPKEQLIKCSGWETRGLQELNWPEECEKCRGHPEVLHLSEGGSRRQGGF